MKKIINLIFIKFLKINKIFCKNKISLSKNLKKEQTNNLRTDNFIVNPEWIFEAVLKKKGIDNQSNKIQTLVLGSSHGEYGINPKYIKDTYNLCLPSQDLYYSYKLYKNSKYKNLKNVLLFFLYFHKVSI